jgi:hypothetical protein
VGAAVVGGAVGVRVGASVGAAVRGAGESEIEGDGLGDGDGLADGAASGCAEITAAPRRSSATSAIAANTVKTVDQRSAGRRSPGACDAAARFVLDGGVSCSVLSASVGLGRSSTFGESARAMPTARCSAARRGRLDPRQQARELTLQQNESNDHGDREERDAHGELEIRTTTIARGPNHVLRTRDTERRISPKWGTNDQTKRSARHSMPSSLGGPMYPSSADDATTAGLAR